MTSTTRIFAAALLLAGLTAGCGRVSSTGAPLPSTGATSAGGKAVLAPTAPKLAADIDPLPQTTPIPQPVASACLGLEACRDTTPLTLTGIEKVKKGFLWRSLKVSGKVYNQGSQPLSGEVQIRFMKKSDVVKTETRTISNVPPGQSVTFTADSPSASDDALVTVSTRGLETKTAAGPQQ